MPITNFAELKTTIETYLDDDLAGETETFIALAEGRHKRDPAVDLGGIRIRDMLRRSQASASGRFLALPATDFLAMKHLRLLTDPVTVLTEVTLHEMSRQRRETTGTPEFFTVHEEIEFDVTPSSAFTAEMIYYGNLTALSDANPSNALLSRDPGAYLYAALLEAEPFLVHDERIAVWQRAYESARSGLNMTDRRRAGPVVARVVGATP